MTANYNTGSKGQAVALLPPAAVSLYTMQNVTTSITYSCGFLD